VRSALAGISWSVLLPAALLATVGVTFVWSTTHTASAPLWGRQLAFLAAGAAAGLVVMRLGVRQLAEASWPLFGLLLLLLAAMPWLARGSPTGTERWIGLVRTTGFASKATISLAKRSASLARPPMVALLSSRRRWCR